MTTQYFTIVFRIDAPKEVGQGDMVWAADCAGEEMEAVLGIPEGSIDVHRIDESETCPPVVSTE